MNESSRERSRSMPSMRERELELELAHLSAELEAARGGDSAEVTSRFLTMAANTVDLAMEDARREADELASEVSADAEARRDEAARLAEEAEARTAALRNEAENHEAVLRAAEEAAVQIKTDAKQEARELVAVERGKVVEEIEALSAVRVALEDERGALESYHDELRRRVQELAESMVSFMTTEPPIAAGSAIEQLVAVPAEPTTFPAVEHASDEDSSPFPTPAVEMNPFADDMVEPESFDDEYSPLPETGAQSESETPERQEEAAESAAAFAPPPNADAVIEAELQTDAVIEAELQTDAVMEVETIVDIENPFGGAIEVDLLAADSDAGRTGSGGLFARATEDEILPPKRGSLFGSHGARLIEQTAPDALADALGEDGVEDERFRSFIAGDDEADPSRDWLLRPEQP